MPLQRETFDSGCYKQFRGAAFDLKHAVLAGQMVLRTSVNYPVTQIHYALTLRP